MDKLSSPEFSAKIADALKDALEIEAKTVEVGIRNVQIVMSNAGGPPFKYSDPEIKLGPKSRDFRIDMEIQVFVTNWDGPQIFELGGIE